ncbi:GTPase [Aciduliprofundum sp. MAR08-339]|uniref:GTPase HflX n=1 Tax=Aciduliprofundum sp. (strain MAR08-339) TaxID=673860 RepID=UPI0002A48053|nr:GTPase [Aciduliprofundum sp. MAR08-339]
MPDVIVVSDGNEEFDKLVKSLGYRISYHIFWRGKINPKYYISKGKIEELKERAKEIKAERVIVDGILKSSQWYNLEREIKLPVDDRIKLIIDIFADRAKSREAMMQVEYANLKYEISHVRETIHRMRLGEHPGFMAGGEYEVADYYEMIRRKMAKIRKELEKLKIQREERRKRRREEGYILVGIAGYTNTGKSTLLKALSGRDVPIEDRMFSTLSTRTSKLGKEKILITDTVGFVDNMPPWLIRAFEPTLEEIYHADIVLLLLDCHDDPEEFRKKFILSLDIIQSRVRGKIIPVINKIDGCRDIKEKIEILDDLSKPVLISAKNGMGIEDLIGRIKEEMKIAKFYAEVEKGSRAYEFIMRFGRVTNVYGVEKMKMVFEMPEHKYRELKRMFDENSTGNGGVLKKI